MNLEITANTKESYPYDNNFRTPAEAAKYLHTTQNKLRNDRYLKRGLSYYKFGRKVYYAQKDIDAFLEAHKVIL